MKIRISIRARLTCWFASCLAVALIVFTLAAIVLMRRSIYITVDEQLRDEMGAVKELIRGTDPSVLPEQVRAHAELQAGSSLLQVSDANGDFLYRSPRLQELGLPVQLRKTKQFQVIWFGRTPLQLQSAEVKSGGNTFTIQVGQDMDDYFEATAKYELLLLIGIPVLLIGAIASGYWVSRRALAPVDEITRAAQNISPRDLTARVSVPETGDELHRLAQTLNAMLQRIEGSFRRITQFTADASHDLRTPVALIRTRAELTLRRPRGEREYQEALQEILEESERITGLIENLMTLARTDVGTEMLHFKTVNICEVAQLASAQGRTLADARRLNWSQTIPDSPLWVSADEQSLGRVLLILIDNAIKYTPPSGSVCLRVSKENGHACVEIRDSGIGIAEVDLSRVFERFYRADSARSRDSDGAGLGLSIGQWIAKAHGGKILVESALNSGSSFQLKLPLSPN